MIENFYPNPIVVQRLQAGPLNTHIDTFAQQLFDAGYALWTVKYAVRLLADLTTWMQQQGLAITDLTELPVNTFFQHRYQLRCPHRDDQAILKKLLVHLRMLGVIAAPVKAIGDPAYASIVQAFQQYLIYQRNLAPSTIHSYLNTVEHFLSQRFETMSPNLDALCAQDVTGFMLQQARRYSAGQTQLIASALRSFFRFLLQQALITTNLAQCVPTPARRRLSTLPKFISADDVERLLHSIEQKTPEGRRNHAIMQLLARLGLRAAEVAALTLNDLDWDAGEIIVRGKGGRCDRLPLPYEVGQAIANYLCDGRPSCSTRCVFVRHRAPQRGFANGEAVGTIVRRALDRAGLNPAHKGAHLLRHSLATRLLRNGASLAEIGELLRHRNINTTQIYAKVDESALRKLALPWPGGEA
ncbi:tyrosine-type recombinase/integrase [Methylobacter sp.]